MINCEAGQHGPIQTRIIESTTYDTCVNVEERCLLCGQRIAIISHTMEAWQNAQRKVMDSIPGTRLFEI